MHSITPAQIRKIHLEARERGMDDDLLHIYVEQITGKKSIRELTIMEGVSVIDSFAGQDHATGATMKQKHLIMKICEELGWKDDSGKADKVRLNGFLSKRFHIDNINWLDRRTASKAIEALKAMKDREGHGGADAPSVSGKGVLQHAE
ncbi:MAG: regulatory protein GemA [Lachnospiraceae bacterium]|nr:regulatory protein GemA [Lachnospiraceae bacterium]